MATSKKDKENDKKKEKKSSAKKTVSPKPRELTEKEELFCHYYLDCKGVAARAYRMAYDTSNMKDETVWNNAYKLKNDNEVATRIEEIRAERRAKSEIKRERAEKKLWNIINASMEKTLIESAKTGKMRRRTPFQIDAETLDAIEQMDIDSNGNVRYKFASANKALELLGKWNGWDAPVQHNVNHTFGDEIALLPETLDEFYEDGEND